VRMKGTELWPEGRSRKGNFIRREGGGRGGRSQGYPFGPPFDLMSVI
jgi:hypothetical protein